jgi:hypothetical protein
MSNREEFLYKNDKKSSILNQGSDYLKNKIKKVEKIITNIIPSSTREGFEGILGPNDAMNDKLNEDDAETEDKKNKVIGNVTHYNTSRQNLTDKTKEYLGDTTNFGKRNYNIFINSLPNPNINDPTTSNYSQCVSTEKLDTSMPHDAAFNTTYPAVGDAPNFDSFEKAKYACKTWAVDSNKPMFAISKSQSSIQSTKASVYQCHVGTKDKADYPIYTKPTLAYDLVDGTSTTSPSATHGGLFSNGLIGVYAPARTVLVTPDLPELHLLDIDQSYLTFNLHKKEKINRLNADAEHFWGWWFYYLDQYWKNSRWIRFTSAEWIWGKHKPNSESGYMYYFHYNPTDVDLWVWFTIIIDDKILIANLNNQPIGRLAGTGGNSVQWAYISLKPGLNVFEFLGYEYTGRAGLKCQGYTYNRAESLWDEVFSSTTTNEKYSKNWALSYTRLDYDKIIKTNIATIDRKKTYFSGYSHSDELFSPYNRCDPFIGGNILASSIQASYGRNCSNTTQKPLMARYIMVENRKGQSDSWLQIAQIEVQGYDGGQLVNLAIKGRNGQGSVKATSTWWNRNYSPGLYTNVRSVAGNLPYLDSAVDGVLGARHFSNGGFHSGSTRDDEYWLLDLGKSYPITKVIYYNRSDCCSHRANGMLINLYNTDTQPNLNTSRTKTFVTNGNPKQEFITTTT